MEEISTKDASPHEDKVLRLPKNYVTQATGNLTCVPICVIGPEVILVNDERNDNIDEEVDDDDKSSQNRRRIYYCSSCDLVTKNNPSINIHGFLKHVREDHPKYNNSIILDFEKLCRAYNINLPFWYQI